MPQRIVRALAASVLAILISLSAHAQTLTIYDEALQNTFADYSYNGTTNFANGDQAHGGTLSVSFIPASGSALSFARPSPDVSSAEYPILRFWVHGGVAGGQQLLLVLQRDGVIVAQPDLDSYVDGGGIVAGAWREVTVPLGPLAASFDRIDLYSDTVQQVLYVDDMVLGQVAAQVADPMTIEHDVTVQSIASDRFTWKDSSNLPRVAVLAHNDGAIVNGSYGGALREFRYQLPNGSTRVASITTYNNGGYGGFGYVVNHSNAGSCVGDDSPLGFGTPGTWTRVFEGRHHAIFRFQQNYPRNCPNQARTIPVTIDWMFSTGHDHPVYAITYDVDLVKNASNVIAPANTLDDDSRAPYGELNIDGDGGTDIDGVAWGDRRKFTSTTAPVTLSSDWTYNVVNKVPYVKEWIAGDLTVDNKKNATMGIVQTQTMSQQDAGGARDPNYHDISDFWDKTSADGYAGGAYKMPYQNEWAYQANANSIGVGIPNNNARLTWRTQWGFLGQTTYDPNDGIAVNLPGYPKKSYSTWIVLGTHSTLPVEAQVTQVETIQELTLSTITGSVVTSGPAGVTRADNVTYDPPGYNHVYGALAFSAQNNVLDANIAVGAGTLKKPLIIVSNYTGADPTVKVGGVTLTADADYFHSLRPSASELWLTLNSDVTGAVNHLEISGVAAGAPTAPTGVTATAFSATQVNISWVAVAGADSYEVVREGPIATFTTVGTPAGNSFSDLTASAATSYFYRVRAVNGSGTSPDSNADLATTVIFTNDPLAAGIAIEAAHLAQLRNAVNAVRALAGLGAAAVTDAASAGVLVRAVHLTELRTALDDARTILALSTGGYSDGGLTGIAVKALHVTELRERTE